MLESAQFPAEEQAPQPPQRLALPTQRPRASCVRPSLLSLPQRERRGHRHILLFILAKVSLHDYLLPCTTRYFRRRSRLIKISAGLILIQLLLVPTLELIPMTPLEHYGGNYSNYFPSRSHSSAQFPRCLHSQPSGQSNKMRSLQDIRK